MPETPVSESQHNPKRRTDELRTASLHAAGVSGRPVGICFITILFGDLAVFLRVGIHHDADHSQFLCPFDFEAAEDLAILHERDLALETHIGGKKVFEVLISAKVDKHIWCRHIAAGRVAMESGHAVSEG